MPYRRLPNTDSARLRALKKALKQGDEVSPTKLAYSQGTLQKLRYFLPGFEQAMVSQQHAGQNQVSRNKDYVNALKKARLYISHFIQVLNMGILRGELPETAREFYGLDKDDKSVPSLSTEKEVISLGERIMTGEAERVLKGGNYITNPTAAVVKVRYEQFLDFYWKQKSLQKINSKSQIKIADLRADADAIILGTWNEIEETFDHMPDIMKRQKSAEYGLVYFFRKSEKNKLKANEAQQEIKVEVETITLEQAMQETKGRGFTKKEEEQEDIVNEKIKKPSQFAFSFSQYQQQNSN